MLEAERKLRVGARMEEERRTSASTKMSINYLSYRQLSTLKCSQYSILKWPVNCPAPHYHGGHRRTSHTDSNPSISPRYGSASHSISVQLISIHASRRKRLPDRSCPDYLVLGRSARQRIFLNRKEAPTCKRHRRCVVAFLANRHTVQHPP